MNNNRKRESPKRRELEDKRPIPPPALEYRREERPPYQENDYRREVGGTFRGNDYRREERPYNGQYCRTNEGYRNDYRRDAPYRYRGQDYQREDGYLYRGGPKGPINHMQHEYPRQMMDNTNTKVASTTRYCGLPRREGNTDECYYCNQKGHRKP